MTDTPKLALENSWSICCSIKTEVRWNRALNFWCLPFFDIGPFLVFYFYFYFFYLPSTLADSFSFFACPLFLSALVYLWGALLCFWSIKYRALLNIPEASGEHLFSCRWLSLLSALGVCNSAGTTHPMYGEWRQSGGQRWMEQMVKLVKGFKLFNPPSSKILIYLKMSLYFP